MLRRLLLPVLLVFPAALAGSIGDSPDNPGRSCLEIRLATGTSTDGLYWIDPTAAAARARSRPTAT
jgi:hypothetical protein